MLVWVPVRVHDIGAAGLDIGHGGSVLLLRDRPGRPQCAVGAVGPQPPALELHWDTPLACNLLLELAEGRLPLEAESLYLYGVKYPNFQENLCVPYSRSCTLQTSAIALLHQQFLAGTAHT